jgi:hypothetical protein
MSKLPEQRTVKRNLRYLLSPSEKLAYGKQLAEETAMLTQIEGDKANVVAQFKAKSTACDARITELSNALRGGYEIRELECVVILDSPKIGKKSIARVDTNEVVEVNDMTELECQYMLDFRETDTPETSETSE